MVSKKVTQIKVRGKPLSIECDKDNIFVFYNQNDEIFQLADEVGYYRKSFDYDSYEAMECNTCAKINPKLKFW